MNISPDRRSILICLILGLVTFAVFYQVHGFEFINFDDNQYIYENPDIQAGLTLQSVKWAFTTGHAGNWHPLTWLSHILDWRLFGQNAGGHHITGLIFHIANTLLLFIVLKKMTKALWQSAFVAALFALHPLHVESVAWVSERKDVLNTLFWLLTMWAYVRYVNKPRIGRYLWIVLFLALGLMAKPMLVTLPFVLLLLDYWPLNRFTAEHAENAETRSAATGPLRKKNKINSACSAVSPVRSAKRLIIEKIPLFLLVIVSSVITYLVQQKGGTFTKLAFKFRVFNAVISYAEYIRKMFWPSDLAFFYPHPGPEVSIPYTVVSALFLIVVTVLIFRFGKNHRYLLTGWLWYLGTLVPVLGVVQVGSQAMADRYTYITLTGLFIIIAWGLGELFAKWPRGKIVLWPASVTLLSVLAVCAYLQTRYWKDDITLYQQAIDVTPNNYTAHFNIAEPLFERGFTEEALWHIREVVRINPKNRKALNTLGMYLYKSGRIDEAAECFEKALAIDPSYADAHFNIASVLMDKGDYAGAVRHYKISASINDMPLTRRKLGLGLVKQGMIEEAVAEYRKALPSMSSDPGLLNELAFALTHAGRPDEAIDLYNKVLLIAPDDVNIRLNFGFALISGGRFQEAAKEYEKILLLDPNNATAHNDYGVALGRLGNLDRAIEHFNEALRINPQYTDAKNNLNIAIAELQKHQ